MTDNEVLSSHSGGERQHLQNTTSNSGRSGPQQQQQQQQQLQQRNRHAPVSSSRSISLGDTPESRIEEDSEDRASNEAKDHSADDEGKPRFPFPIFFSVKTQRVKIVKYNAPVKLQR